MPFEAPSPRIPFTRGAEDREVVKLGVTVVGIVRRLDRFQEGLEVVLDVMDLRETLRGDDGLEERLGFLPLRRRHFLQRQALSDDRDEKPVEALLILERERRL